MKIPVVKTLKFSSTDLIPMTCICNPCAIIITPIPINSAQDFLTSFCSNITAGSDLVPISGHPTQQGKRTGLHISGRNLLQCYQDCVGASKVVCESAIEFPAHRELKRFSTVSLGLLSVQCWLLRLHEHRYANSIDRCVHHDGNDGNLVVMELIWTDNHLGSSWFLLFGSAAAQE